MIREIRRAGGNMHFARKIIDPVEISNIIELPDELLEPKVEVIVLPVDTPNDKQNKKKRGKDLIDKLHDNPLKIKNFRPFKRQEIYDR
jgi:hypothetical protein